MKRTDIYIALACFIAALALYIRTLAPGLLYGDSAELQTIAYSMGMGHPTGYPTYIFLAKAFTQIPIGEIAYRVNLFSGVAEALSVGLVYLITRMVGSTPAASIFASLLLAITPLFWKYGSIAEVYALSSAWLALILLVMLKWGESKNSIWLFIAGMFGGLSLGVHTLIIFTAPAILLYLALSPKTAGENIRSRVWPSFLGLLLGGAIYLSLFLYLDARNSPAGYYNTVVTPSLSLWGLSPADFASAPQRLAFLYFPPQFRGQFFAVHPNEVLARLWGFAREYSILLMFSLAGIISFFISLPNFPARPREGWLFITSLMAFISFASAYDVTDYVVYFIPSILILAICAGRGVQAIVSIIGSTQKHQQITTIIVFLVCSLIGLAPLSANLPNAIANRMPPGLDEKQTYGFQYPGNYKLKAEKIVSSLEDNAIVFTDWDRVYDLYYVSNVLHGRSGMDFHEIFPQKDVNLPATSMLAYIDQNIANRPIYFTKYPASLIDLYNVVPVETGLYKVERK